MATLKTIQAQNKILEEKLSIDFNPIKEVVIEYSLTAELITTFTEGEKEINAIILQKVSKELMKVKGINTNSKNFNQIFAIALENLGEDYINKIQNDMRLKRAEILVLSFENSPTKNEIIEYFETLNNDEKIVEMFYNNFMLSCYTEFTELVNKYNNPVDSEKVGK